MAETMGQFEPRPMTFRDERPSIRAGSVAFAKANYEAATATYAPQNKVLTAQSIPIQGVSREVYRS